MCKRVLLMMQAALMVLLATACIADLDNAGGIVIGAVREYKETVDMSGENRGGQPLKLDIDMKLAEAVIEGTEDKLAEVEFKYNSDALRPEFKATGEEIRIKNKLEKFNFGKPVNKWNVGITGKLPLEVKLKADNSKARLDMGSMLISRMDAVFSASDVKLYFDELNEEPLDKFNLDLTAGSTEIYGAGNIGFEVLDINADGSKITIDFAGESKSSGEVRINADASAVKLKLPEDIGVRIIIDKYEISSVRVNNGAILSRSEKEYVSRDYKAAGRTLDIYADLNVTTLTIE